MISIKVDTVARKEKKIMWAILYFGCCFNKGFAQTCKKKKKLMKITQVIIRPKTTSIFSALIATEPLICLYLKGSAVNHGEYHKLDVMRS